MADPLTSQFDLLELEEQMKKEFFTSSSILRAEYTRDAKVESVETPSSNSEFLANLERAMRKEFFMPRFSFEYPRLSSASNVRLLHLDPGDRGDPIEGCLEEVSIGSKPNFEALSYTWGDATKPYTVSTPEGVLSITSSLRSALVRFRYPDRARTLWVDALCINQNDNEEKSDQILLMPKIYSYASKVLVYLGDEANGSQLVIKLIEKIARGNFSKLQNKFDEVGQLFPLENYGIPSDEDNSWKAFRAFWRRPWFRRVWIIQEFLLGRDVSVVCGGWQRDWKIFYEAAVKINELGLIHRGPRSIFDLNDVMEANSGFGAMSLLCHYRAQANSAMYMEYRLRLLLELPHSSVLEAGQSNMPEFNSLVQLARQNPGVAKIFSDGGAFSAYPDLFGYTRADPGTTIFSGMPLMTAFEMTEISQATHAKDRMFALFSLANDLDDEDRSLLRPDYNMPPRLIVCRYASVLIRQGHCMHLLYRGSIWPGSLKMPSWAPDWTKATTPLVKRSLLGIAGAQIYQAAGNSEARVRISKDGDILIVTGSFLDIIDWVGVVPGITTTSIMEADRMCDGISSYPTGESLSEVKWRTLVANKATNGRTEAPREYGIQYKAWAERMNSASSAAQTLSQQLALCPPTSGAYAEALGTVRNYKLCRTRGGYVGLVPLSSVIGDSIGIFLGGIIPFTLRKSLESERQGMFRVVGGCYIHGYMKGEALGFPQWREQEISLY